MKTVLITKIKNNFDKHLAAVFEREGYKVYTADDAVSEKPESINIYIDTTDERSQSDKFDVRSGINEQVIKELYEANVIQPMSLLEEFLPLLESGGVSKECPCKRLCYLTAAQASINETRETDGYGYKMAKAALHNFLQITRNVLAPKGYTIRVYDPLSGEVPPEKAAEAAFNYFTRNRGVERGDPLRDDETNLVFRDAYGRQHSW